MDFYIINEKSSIAFVDNVLNYYSQIDDGSINTILTSKDYESQRNNVEWYQYIDNQHKIFINVPNMLYLKYALDRKEIGYDAYYAFLTLCIGHEFRHFLQGRCIWEKMEIDEFDQKDVLNAQQILYIKKFFDAYYLLNKGYIKFEEDAEKFAIVNGINFLKANFPDMNADNAMLDAIQYYANIQSRGGIVSTLPLNGNSIEEILFNLDDRIMKNWRIKDLTQTLCVFNPKCYSNHFYFDLSEDKLITEELMESYTKINDGNKQDLLVVKQIISLIKKSEESLEEFPTLKKYLKSN